MVCMICKDIRRYDEYVTLSGRNVHSVISCSCKLGPVMISFLRKVGVDLRFMESYKRLEKLCGEMWQCDRPVLTYIEEMKRNPQGVKYVPGWEADRKRLDHYRWVRNKITHDPNCTEENMCSAEDAVWLEDFYARIMRQEDPLALYRKATQPYPRQTSAPCKKMVPRSNRGLYLAAGILALGIVAVAVGILLMLL